MSPATAEEMSASTFPYGFKFSNLASPTATVFRAPLLFQGKMKLDATDLRYITSEEFRVLTAVCTVAARVCLET